MKTVIYGFGIAGKWAVDQFDEVLAFIDTDQKKCGVSFKNVEVQEPSYLSKFDWATTQLIVSVVDIAAVIPIIEDAGVTNWLPLSNFIDLDVPFSNSTGESDSFLRYSLQTVKACQESHLHGGKVFIRSVDLVITEKCTLKCKDWNLMQFVSPRNIDSLAVWVSAYKKMPCYQRGKGYG